MPRRPILKIFRNALLAVLALAGTGVLLWAALSADVRAHEPEDDAARDELRWLSGHGHDGDRPFLGVTLEEETESDDGGARITRVIDGSAAAEAGLEEGDVIVGFDGKTIRGPGGLTRRMRDLEPGDRVEVVVLREGGERTFDVELGRRSATASWVMPDLDELHERLEDLHLDLDLEGLRGLGERFRFELRDCEGDDCSQRLFGWYGRPRLGVQLTDTTPELRRHLGGEGDAGMLVTRVFEDSPAERAGIRVGDLIVTVDGDAIDGTFDIVRALADRGGASVEVGVIRDGSALTLHVALPEVDERSIPRSRGPRAGATVSAGAAREMARAGREAAAEVRRIAAEARALAGESQRADVETARRALALAREQAREARQLSQRQAREALRGARELRRRALDEAREALARRNATLM